MRPVPLQACDPCPRHTHSPQGDDLQTILNTLDPKPYRRLEAIYGQGWWRVGGGPGLVPPAPPQGRSCSSHLAALSAVKAALSSGGEEGLRLLMMDLDVDVCALYEELRLNSRGEGKPT